MFTPVPQRIQRAHRSPLSPGRAGAGMAAAMLGLQRTAGNAATVFAEQLIQRNNGQAPKANIPNPGARRGPDQRSDDRGYLRQISLRRSAHGRPGHRRRLDLESFCKPAAMPAGFIGPLPPSASTSSTAAGCGCRCMAGSGHTWTIVVDDASWPHTNFDDDAADVLSRCSSAAR